MTPTPITRRYTIADPYMFEYAKTLRGHFITDQLKFVAEDSNFANPYEGDWQSAINTSEAIPTQEQREDQLMQLTDTVLTTMSDCRNVYQGAKRYIKKAFPDNSSVWKEFGFDDYDSIEKSQPRMLHFMKRFYDTAVKYTAQLIAPAVNFPQTRIDAIEAARKALDDANNAQEQFKGDMLSFTRQRIAAHNALWAICTDVAGVGKQLFRNEYARYQLYLLPASEEPAGTLLLSGTITDSLTGAPIPGVLVELQPHGLQSTTDSNGMYGFGSAPAGAATLRITHPLYEEQNLPGNIDPANPQVLDVVLVALPPTP